MVEYKYDAWGDHNIELSDASYENLAKANPFRYRGYYYDEETGLYYLKSRYYDPEVGRFITIDDISYIDPESINGLNLYAYCGNNPVMNVDPNGHKWWEFWKWDWAKIGMIALSVIEVIGGAILTVFAPGIGATIGAGLIGVGIGAMIGAISNEKNGGGFFAGWAGGQVGGIVSIIPGVGPFVGAFLNSIVIDAIDKGNINWGNAGISSFIGFVFGYFSYVFNEIGSSNQVLAKLAMSTVSGLISLIKTIIDRFGFGGISYE